MAGFGVVRASFWAYQFLQFLQDTDREQTSLRETLRTIYNEEFRCRTEERTPRFSSILKALRKGRQVQVCGEVVKFKVKSSVVVADQYRRPRTRSRALMSMSAPGQQFSSSPLQICSKQWYDQQHPAWHGPRIPQLGWERLTLLPHRAEVIPGKHGVVIVSDYDRGYGNIRFPVVPDQPQTVTILVRNCGTKVVTLQRFLLRQQSQELSFTDEQGVVKGQSLLLRPGCTCPIQVRCLTSCNGHFSAVVIFEFIREPATPFSISRYIAAVAESQLAKELGPSAPFQPYEASLQHFVTVITEDGIPPSSSHKNALEREIRLGTYQYPKSLKDTILLGPNSSASSSWAAMRSLLEAPLQAENYHEKLQLLLHLEEIQMEVDIRRYDMQDVTMARDRALLVLQVPGVAESRPSLLAGDHLFVHLSSKRDRSPLVRYKGYVHSVELEKVSLGFSSKLMKKFVSTMKFDVTFTFNRLPLQVQHRAVALAKRYGLFSLLFPSASCHRPLFPGPFQPWWFNSNLETNEEQCKAVIHIVNGMSRPAPYIIFGPPGTGKTVTMVEAIKQVWACFRDARILACAPSNSATDLLCQCLIKDIDPQNVYRLIASTRNYREIPTDIMSCCNWDDEQSSYVYPSKESLRPYRIITTTLVTAGRLVSANFPPGFFTHVFIDECGQALEPESVVAITGLLAPMDPETNPNGGQLVLAGDPKQLGPILTSPLAIQHGLGISLLERLMLQNPLYKKSSGGYDPQFITKLLWNYRSHEAILRIPNELFYDNELKACRSDGLDIRNLYCTWEELPKKGFPIIFHGVCGEDQREAKSPSFFNTAEIEVLVHYLKKLLQSQGKECCLSVSPKEIGIISPYRKQVEKIRKAITCLDPDLQKLPDISQLKVGSVEEFQGQERHVILISTVRSCSTYLQFDQTFRLGFLKNPKRLNVAITRAKALLIVVGNPVVLSKDRYWHRFLRYCKEEGGYTGYPYEDEDSLSSDLHKLQLGV
ncbi:SDE3 helicase, partial [Regulus satrapa]|nr:SDE3 helicase [Regulus satrapa]